MDVNNLEALFFGSKFYDSHTIKASSRASIYKQEF